MALRWSLFSTLSLSLSLKLLTVSTPYPPRRCVAVMRVSLLLYSDKLRPLSPSKFSSLSLSPSPCTSMLRRTFSKYATLRTLRGFRDW
jgi:hypothetical protein